MSVSNVLHPDDLNSRWFSLAKQGKELIAATKGIQGLIDYLWLYDVQPERKEAFERCRLDARDNIRVQTAALNDIEKHLKKHGHIIDRREELRLEEAAMALLNDEKEYFRIIDLLLDHYDVDPSGVVVLAWIGHYEAGFRAICSAYEGLRLALEDYNSYDRADHFHIAKWEWRRGYVDLIYGNTTGNSEYSVGTRTILQELALAGFQNYKLDDDLGGTSLRQAFRENQLVETFGYLNEHWNHQFYPLLSRASSDLSRSKSIIMPPLLTKVLNDVVVSRPLVITVSPFHVFKWPIQQMNAAYWQTGELSGTIRLFPSEFNFVPTSLVSGSVLSLGDKGVGKTTLQTAIDYCFVEKHEGVVLFPYSPPLNWQELMCMPLMQLPGDSTFEFLTQTLHVKPKGIPVLILNVVDSLDRLKSTQLTKYDRILKVPREENFEFNIDRLLEELKGISEGFGKKHCTGVLALRNLRDKIMDESRQIVESDLYNAARFLFEFMKWRPDNPSLKMRITWDEVRNMASISSKGQDRLRACYNELMSATRNQQTPIDFGTDKIRDTTNEVRETVDHIFFGRLPRQAQESKSPEDIILGGLDIDRGQLESVKLLRQNGFLAPKYHLMIHHDKSIPGSLDVISPMPAPCQKQLVGISNNELKKLYAKLEERSGRPSDFLRRASEVPVWEVETVDKEEEIPQTLMFS